MRQGLVNRAAGVGIVILVCAGLCMGQQPQQDLERVEAAKKLVQTGRYDEAMELFQEIIDLSVNDQARLSAYTYLAFVHYYLNPEEEVRIVTLLEEALKIDPGFILNEEEFNQGFVALFEKIKAESTGIISLESVPSLADIYLDGIYIGKTPLKKELNLGEYRIQGVKPGYSVLKLDFEIKPSDRLAEKLDFNRSKNWKTFLRSVAIMAAIGFTVSQLR